MIKTKIIFAIVFLALVFSFSGQVLAQDLPGVQIPDTGLASPEGGIKEILMNFLKWLLGIVGMLALIAFSVSGAQYMLSTGNEEIIDTAKKNMTWAVIGIVVVLSGLIIITAIDAALRAENTLF
ncbi:MAG: hypothetical protein A2288_00565 [Candidatus Moranbacteria bacterium RIFOXYA12_FULL_44_15]|nr:MAG: hypothetical protein A2288_00565 [Candidatus Moranbacteria bacterium RIFOXYA12_FULL_44_15]OGI35430.1 MAG: hypothetical protein A2259_00050 [Candidatus Moranbacteria bacterium RIFOXYA2_FULL_43_15]